MLTEIDPAREAAARAAADRVAALLPHPEQTPTLTWSEFLAQWDWRQGEHLTCVGPTGCGKTTTQLALLRPRRFVTLLGTKPKDPTLDRFCKEAGYTRLKRWRTGFGPFTTPPPIGKNGAHYALWPPFRGIGDRERMAEVFRDAFPDIFAAGGWTVCADELYYLANELGLGDWLNTLWTQGRSVKISLSGGAQRPRHVPLFAWDQASHLLMWRDNDDENLRRVGGLGGLSSRIIRETVPVLPRHWFLYVNTRDGRLAVAKAEG